MGSGDGGDAVDAYRDFGRKLPATPSRAPRGRQLITVIGIDDYRHWAKLTNAVNDARGVLDLFEKELFFERACEPLYNEAATKQAITDLVFDQLSKTLKPDDALVLFFAGHGHSETRGIGDAMVESGYLVPWEAQTDKRNDFINVDDLLGELSLLPSLHVLFIVDACHSGIAMGESMRRYREGEIRYEDQLASLRSRKIITSARRDQLALDGGPIPNHSLFTSHLIHGLRTAEADTDNNDIVSGRELGLYLQQKVAQATWGKKKRSRQTPDFGEFGHDARGELVISLKREQVVSNIAAGRSVRIVGERLNDRARIDSAIRYLDTAIKLSPAPSAEALLERGKANFAAGRYDLASQGLSEARKVDPDSADMLLFLGVSEAMRDREDTAREALRAFIALPVADARKDWAQRLIDELGATAPARSHALLIGIGEYAPGGFFGLKGPPNDVKLLRDLLLESGHFEPDDVTLLIDDDATHSGILKAFQTLSERAGPNDRVLVHFSGHATSADEPGYLAAYDTTYDTDASERKGNQYARLITEDELNDFMTGLAAINRVLILDTHVTNRFDAIAARQHSYTVLMATTPTVWAREHPITNEAGEQAVYGAFTWALAAALREEPDAPLGRLMETVSETIANPVSDKIVVQLPVFHGLADRSFWSQRRPRNHPLLAQLDLAPLRRYHAVTNDRLARVADEVNAGLPAWPELRTSMGAALVQRGRYRRAAEVLRAQESPLGIEAACVLATALVRTGAYEEAASLLRGRVEAKADTASRLETAIEIIDTLRTSQAHALLVGVDVPPVATGSRADIDEMRGVLLEAGLAEANVQILTGEDASASAIRSSFKTLAARAKDAPALFYYAGPGTLMDMRTPGITDFARTAIPLEWFRSTVGDDITNLITIFDAGWKSADLPWGPSPGSRFSVVWTTPRDLVWPQAGIGRPGTTRPGGTGLPDRQRDSILSGLEEMRIGRATIFHVSIRHTVRMAHNDLTGETVLESDYETSDGISRRGILTSALITELRKSQGIRLVRLREVADGLRSSMAWLEPFVLCDNPEQPVLANTVKEDRIAGILHEIADLSPVVDAIAALEALRRESRSADPSVHVDTAAAFAALHDYTASLDALDAARRAAVGEDPEIEFERGRVLFESGRDFDAAVSSLHKAVRATPDRPEAHYYLGAAIRSRVEREAEELDRAVEAFNRYLTLGAPLGHTEEIEAFLSHRRNAP